MHLYMTLRSLLWELWEELKFIFIARLGCLIFLGLPSAIFWFICLPSFILDAPSFYKWPRKTKSFKKFHVKASWAEWIILLFVFIERDYLHFILTFFFQFRVGGINGKIKDFHTSIKLYIFQLKAFSISMESFENSIKFRLKISTPIFPSNF